MTLVDPVSAFFSGFTSTPARLLLFCIGALLGHGAGLISASVVDDTPFFAINISLINLAGLPVSFLWQLLQNFLFGPGIVYTLLLGVLFFLVLFTEVLPVISLSLLIILQVWDTFFMQRALASHVHFPFHAAPNFSDWGYGVAGAFTLVPALLASMPFVLSLVAKRARCRAQEGRTQENV